MAANALRRVGGEPDTARPTMVFCNFLLSSKTSFGPETWFPFIFSTVLTINIIIAYQFSGQMISQMRFNVSSMTSFYILLPWSKMCERVVLGIELSQYHDDTFKKRNNSHGFTICGSALICLGIPAITCAALTIFGRRGATELLVRFLLPWLPAAWWGWEVR